MRQYKLWVCLLALGLASPALADSFLTHIDYNVGVSVTGITTQSNDSMNTVEGDTVDTIHASDTFDVGTHDSSFHYGHDDTASIGFAAHVAIGGMGAAVGGSVSSSTSGVGLFSTDAEADGGISAFWYDFATIIGFGLQDGTPLKVDSFLILKGHLSGSASGQIVPNQHFAGFNASVFLKGVGSLDIINGATGTALSQSVSGGITQSAGQDLNMVIPITYTAIQGDSELLGEEMSLSGSASARTLFTAPGIVTGDFTASFADTLLWGGISSVTDLATGLPVLDYTVTSASGFDYSKPAPTPEPSSGMLAAAGIGLLAIWRRLPVFSPGSRSVPAG
jgi:hypothetical protein